MCETVDVDPALATLRRPIGSGFSARKSKLGRFRQGWQRDRRALQAETEKDLEFIRRFEVEVGVARDRQRTRELQLRDVLMFGTSTTVDKISEITGTRTLCCPPTFTVTKGPLSVSQRRQSRPGTTVTGLMIIQRTCTLEKGPLCV